MNTNPTNILRPSGFTLVELLVVILIVVVLATIGFTGAQKMMDSAARSRTMGHMKQLATTGQLFSSENNGIIPHVQHTAIGGSKRIWCQHYAVALFPDLASNDQFREKSGDEFGRDAAIFADPKAFKKAKSALAKSGPNSWRTYAYNNRIGAASPENPGELAWVRGARHVGQVDAPNKLIFFTQKTLAGDNYPQFLQPEDASAGTVDFKLHGGAAIVGFYDGHVELIQKRSFPSDAGINPSTGRAYSAAEMNEFWLGRVSQLPQL